MLLMLFCVPFYVFMWHIHKLILRDLRWKTSTAIKHVYYKFALQTNETIYNYQLWRSNDSIFLFVLNKKTNLPADKQPEASRPFGVTRTYASRR